MIKRRKIHRKIAPAFKEEMCNNSVSDSSKIVNSNDLKKHNGLINNLSEKFVKNNKKFLTFFYSFKNNFIVQRI